MFRVVHAVYSLGVGGTENGVVNLINALNSSFGHTVISMTDAGPLADRLPKGVEVHSLGKRPGIDVRAIARLAGLLRKLAPDLVHARNWAAFDAVPAARLAGIPMVIHGEHGREASDPHGLNRKRNRLRRLLSPLVNCFVTVSFDLQRWLKETVGIPARKIVTIHNGVDTARFSSGGREPGRRALGLPQDQIVVGTVGRLDPVKDQAGLLRAFKLAREAHPGALLVIVGDGPCRAELSALAAELGLGAWIRFLGERADVPLLLKGMDLFVLPSIAEGISNTILEAMATGLPVVATRTGGNLELVEDAVTGMLVPVDDPQALAGALAAYLSDPELRALHGRAGRQRAMDEFSLERMVGRYRDLYLSVLDR
jgi:sugar transferase (PEP-CTERM/EpsH1 system associated)